jgi:ubiquinone/menaquinone biosynthesis C-methylase UbiE
MKKRATIELLSTDLLDDKVSFRSVYFWIKIFIAEVGWHYPLDLIWQYKKIKELDLPKGAIIVDAGAGHGMMQFILAGQGYNVLSIDFSSRKLPFLQSKLFKMKNERSKSIKNDYTKHLTLVSKLSFSKVFNKIKLAIINFSGFYLIKGFVNKNKYGSIKYIQADFSDLSFIKSNTIDAVVSTSAIEHNPVHENLKKGISEFNRILKPNSSMFITTSVTNDVCVFDNPTKGYFYDERTLVSIFNLDEYSSNFNSYSEIFDHINKNKFLKKMIPFNYKKTPNCGMPYGKWNIRYLPVGITKIKDNLKIK